MFPILYDHIERNVNAQHAPKLIVPQHYGLGVLSSCISCEVEQERNGKYELVMVYPKSGIHASEIAYRRILKVKPNFTDDPQLFRIDRVGKTMKDGNFTVYAKHISYDISGYSIISGSAINAAAACQLLREATNNDFNITTTKQVSANFSIKEPSSVRSWFAGKEGSFLDVFGTAEIKYDNFNVGFPLHAGTDRGVEIRYKKNLLELSQEIDSSNLYTHVICYYKPSEGPSIAGDPVSTGLVLDVPRTLTVDVTSNYQETPDIIQLTNDAIEYKNSHNLTIPNNNIKLDYVQSGELTNRVDLCDTVSIYYEALGITRAEVKCIRTKWDCLREKYIETEFGDVKTKLEDTITESTALVDDAKSTADAAMSAVGSKKRVFINQPVPPYDIGDLWINNGGVYYCSTPRTESIIKELESDSELSFESAIAEDFIECVCQIEADEEGVENVIISVSNGDDDPETRVEKLYLVDLEETLTQGGVFKIFYGLNEEEELVRKAVLIRTDETEKEFDISQINIPETIVGQNVVTCNTGDIAIKYYETGFSRADWDLGTDYVNDDEMSQAITYASQLITGGLGGNVIINRNEETGMPYEIVIFKTENPTDEQTLDNAKWVWRWNINGLGFSDQGYDAPDGYKTAITYDGKINASMITTGELDAQDAGIQNLTASMFAGQMIQLGGADMPDGKLVILDQSNNVLIKMDIDGLECFGAEVNGVIPSVVFDKNGVTGYSNSADKENTAIFWTKEQDFHMKNAVIENQMDIGGMLKFLPFTIKDSNNNITNQGIAVVANT